MDERCAKGLCDKCDDKYTPDHRCKHLYDCWVDASEERRLIYWTQVSVPKASWVGSSFKLEVERLVEGGNEVMPAMVYFSRTGL